MNDFDTSNFDLEQASGGRNKIILDDLGNPSVMVAVPAFKISDVMSTIDSDDWHPAFIIDNGNGNRSLIPVIWMSKYQNIVVDGRAYSLAGKTPGTNIRFNTAVEMCKNKGSGWHLMTNAEWAAVAELSIKNNTIPYGNDNNGSNYDKPWLKGIPTTYSNEQITFVKTGTMGALSSHDGTDFGIMDMSGNGIELVAGIRQNHGEFNIIPYNNAALATCNMDENSSEWKAMLQDGTLVIPGENNTLKINGSRISTNKTYVQPYGYQFCDIKPEDGVIIPDIMKILLLSPELNDFDYRKNKVMIHNVLTTESLLVRNSSFVLHIHANGDKNPGGIFGYTTRSRLEYSGLTFRSCYYDPDSLIPLT